MFPHTQYEITVTFTPTKTFKELTIFDLGTKLQKKVLLKVKKINKKYEACASKVKPKVLLDSDAHEPKFQ